MRGKKYEERLRLIDPTIIINLFFGHRRASVRSQ